MNVGQILETHLGWAAAGLGRRIGEVLEKVRRNGGNGAVGELRQLLGDIYDGDGRTDIEALPDDELIELAGELTHGVPMASPGVRRRPRGRHRRHADPAPGWPPRARSRWSTAAPARRSTAR